MKISEVANFWKDNKSYFFKLDYSIQIRTNKINRSRWNGYQNKIIFSCNGLGGGILITISEKANDEVGERVRKG